MPEGQYVAAVSPADIEWERVGLLEAMCDGITTRYLDALGVKANSVRLNFCMAVELSDASGQYARSIQLPWPIH